MKIGGENVVKAHFGGDPFPQLAVLTGEILDLVHAYDGEIPLASVLGVFRMVEFQLIQGALEE